MIEITNISGMLDCENASFMSDSTAERFRMTKNTDVRGEGRHWQKALHTAALSLALSFFIAAPVMAQAPTPTLDRVKEENTNFINSTHLTYELKELTADETATEGSITVKIGDKTYYYTPNEGDNTNTLQILYL